MTRCGRKGEEGAAPAQLAICAHSWAHFLHTAAHCWQCAFEWRTHSCAQVVQALLQARQVTPATALERASIPAVSSHSWAQSMVMATQARMASTSGAARQAAAHALQAAAQAWQTATHCETSWFSCMASIRSIQAIRMPGCSGRPALRLPRGLHS